jgi:hypothetical protein
MSAKTYRRANRGVNKRDREVQIMLEYLEQQKKFTINQWKIFAAATIGDMLDFFDFLLIAFILAFIVKDWNLTYGRTSSPLRPLWPVLTSAWRRIAVVDEIDARLDLFLYHLGKGRADPGRPMRRGRPAPLPPWQTSPGSDHPAAAGCRCGWSKSGRTRKPSAPPTDSHRRCSHGRIKE